MTEFILVFRVISEKTAMISLKSINWLVLRWRWSVFCVRHELFSRLKVYRQQNGNPSKAIKI